VERRHVDYVVPRLDQIEGIRIVGSRGKTKKMT